MSPLAREVLEFWLGDARHDPAACQAKMDCWFGSDPRLDAELRERFGPLVDTAVRGELDAWKATPEGRLALVILLDQFPRNLWRGSARAFEHDAAALALTLEALESGEDRSLSPVECTFLYLPLEHSEDAGHQARCVDAFDDLAYACQPEWQETVARFRGYAVSHKQVIERFGRFPHRNAALGRTSTPEERRWLDEGGGF